MTWFVQTALGLHYMHTNRVLHRDIKTQNVFILSSGRVVLGDLGISKVGNDGCFAQYLLSLLLSSAYFSFFCFRSRRQSQFFACVQNVCTPPAFNQGIAAVCNSGKVIPN